MSCYQVKSYYLRYIVDDDMELYLVCDLLDQYNKRHHTNYTFEQYLEQKQTQEILIKKFHLSGKKYMTDKLNKVMKHTTYTKEDGSEGEEYAISEEWLINCLMWVDPLCAWDFCKLFKENYMETEENNRSAIEWAHKLCKEVKKFQKMLKDLRDEYALDVDLSTDTLVL